MTEFLAELYVPRTDPAAAARCAELAGRAAQALTREGTHVRYLRSIFVREDETCFLLLEAASADHVRAAMQRAALRCDHVGVVES